MSCSQAALIQERLITTNSNIKASYFDPITLAKAKSKQSSEVVGQGNLLYAICVLCQYLSANVETWNSALRSMHPHRCCMNATVEKTRWFGLSQYQLRKGFVRVLQCFLCTGCARSWGHAYIKITFMHNGKGKQPKKTYVIRILVNRVYTTKTG